ncbi:MAG: hypothetical protein ACI4WX_10890 [Aristaeellaceae bacterium]
MSDVTNHEVKVPILMGLTMDLAEDGFERAEQILAGIPGGAKKATGSALARAGNAGKTTAKRAVTEEYNVSPGLFSAYTRNINHFKSEAGGGLSVVFGYQGRTIPLIHFVRSPGTPVHVSVMKGAGATLDHAFDANVNGHFGIFERVGKKRFPIKELYGPSTPQMMYSNEAVLDKVEEKVVETFEKRLDHEISRILNGYGR